MAVIKTRQSGVELLRILSMLLVLLLHTNSLAYGLPGVEECQNLPLNSFCRLLVQSLSVVCVDVFVFISGWFGIRFNTQRLAGFLFQCLFFSIIVTLTVWVTKGCPPLGVKTLIGLVFLGKSYWFVKCYLLLYILSPLLNAFVDSADERTFRKFLLLFLAVWIGYGWTDSMPEFNFGYSTISFVGIYLLARYIRLHGSCLCSLKSYQYGLIYLFTSICLAGVSLLMYSHNCMPELTRCLFSYANPLTLLGAVSLFLMFSKFEFQSAFVNTLAESSFAVYLFHCGPFVWTMFLTKASSIVRNHVCPLKVVDGLYKFNN